MSLKDLKEYEEASIYRAKNKIDSRIKNSSIEHANILIKTMINHASDRDDLYIYSGSLPEDTFSMLAGTKAKKINVLVDNDTKLDWLNQISTATRGKMSVSRVDATRPNHFLCTTGGFFRFETDAEKYEAEANFNESQAVDVLVKAFNRYSEKSQKVF